VGGADQRPFGLHRFEAAQQELSKSSGLEFPEWVIIPGSSTASEVHYRTEAGIFSSDRIAASPSGNAQPY
jgi:hypothetical protein